MDEPVKNTNARSKEWKKSTHFPSFSSFYIFLLHTQQKRLSHSTPWSTHQQHQQHQTESASTRRLATKRLSPASGDSSNTKRESHSSLNSHPCHHSKEACINEHCAFLENTYRPSFLLALFIASVCPCTRNLTSRFTELQKKTDRTLILIRPLDANSYNYLTL